MLCSGCKLTARRWGQELQQRPEISSTNEQKAYDALNEALNETCNQIPDPLVSVPGPDGPTFQAYSEVLAEDPDLAKKATRNAERSRLMAHRLCLGVMVAFVKDLVQEVSGAVVAGQALPVNWERFLCARKAKLCKRNMVADADGDSDESDSVHVADSIEKRREAEYRRENEKRVQQAISAMMSEEAIGRDDFIQNTLRNEL